MLILNSIVNAVGNRRAEEIWSSSEDTVRAILDPSHYTRQKKHLEVIEKNTRRYLFAIHLHRTTELSEPVKKSICKPVSPAPAVAASNQHGDNADRHPTATGVPLRKRELHRTR